MIYSQANLIQIRTALLRGRTSPVDCTNLNPHKLVNNPGGLPVEITLVDGKLIVLRRPALTTCTICDMLGLCSAWVKLNGCEPPPNTRKKSPAYCEEISDQTTESHRRCGSG